MTLSNGKHMAIVLENVSKTYHSGGSSLGAPAEKVKALNQVELAVGHGEILGLVGESGSGKTTLGRLIVRLERPSSGSIKVNDAPIARLKGRDLKEFRQRVQMIFQDPYQSLNPYLSVLQTVSEPLQIHKKGSTGQIRDKVLQTLDTAGLSPANKFLDVYPHQLSGGQRQRVAIARAMVLDPQVVVADEPTSMLDASISIQIFQILADIQRRKKMTLIFITHSLAAAKYLCHKIAVIYRGHIVETGPAKEIISSPIHPYTQALLDALPRFGHVNQDRIYYTLRPNERQATSSSGCPFYSRCNRARMNPCANQRPELLPVAGDRCAACFYA